MDKYDILLFPHPFLKKKIKPLPLSDFLQLKKIVKAMFKTMYDSGGIGLAANQVGVDKRLFVMDVPDVRKEGFNAENFDSLPAQKQQVAQPTPKKTARKENNPMVCVNPKITFLAEKLISEEGCLSIPGVIDKVERFTNIQAEYYDLSGSLQTINLTGLEAICFQHELDHLDGKLFWDRMPTLRRNILKKKFLKQQSEPAINN